MSDGNIYEGMDFLLKEIPRTDGANELIIALIGDFPKEQLRVSQFQFFFGFLNISVERDMIDRNYYLSTDEHLRLECICSEKFSESEYSLPPRYSENGFLDFM